MARRLAPSLLALLLAAGCQAHLRAPAGARPLDGEAEVWVYLRPLPPEAERLSFELAGLAAVAADGTEVPLQLRAATVARGHGTSDRLLAYGRLPPGRYDGFAVRVARASLAGEAGRADLLVPADPVQAPVAFAADRGGATVVSLTLRYPPSTEQSFRFEPSLAAAIPERPVPDLTALCANGGAAGLTVADRRSRRVAAVIPTDGAPRAVALDAGTRRVFVALSDADEVQVLDVASRATQARVRLSPGDRPADLALTPDGRTLVVANEGSRTASFVDTATLAEVQRVPTGDGPASVLVDRAGRRAYVLDRRGNAITVLDVANRAVVGTLATDPEPLRAALDAAGRRLYVVHAGSPYLAVFSLPDLAPAGRVFVGMGARTVLVDSRTDLLYVGLERERRLDVYDPFALAPVTTVDVPAPVGFLVIDDAENALWALMPEARAIAVLDLTTRELLGTLDVGEAPAALAVSGARP